MDRRRPHPAEWFAAAAAARGLDLTVDRAGNQWARRGDPDATPGVVIGSHLDSVPDGGATTDRSASFPRWR